MPQAHIKLEAYGFAIADAAKALELDPSYTKVSSSVDPSRLVSRTQEKLCSDPGLGILEASVSEYRDPKLPWSIEGL